MTNQLNKFKKLVFTSNSLIFLFLVFNTFKLYQISADLKIQLLNLLLSLGIIVLLEDRNKKIEGFKKYKAIIRYFGISLLILIFVRASFLITVKDKFYYFLLPSGISSILLIISERQDINLYKK